MSAMVSDIGLKPTIRKPLITMLAVKNPYITHLYGYRVYFLPISVPLRVFPLFNYPGDSDGSKAELNCELTNLVVEISLLFKAFLLNMSSSSISSTILFLRIEY